MSETERIRLRGKLEGLLSIEKWFALQSRTFRTVHKPVLDQIRVQREAAARIIEHQESKQ